MLALIIWGSRNSIKNIGQGQFACPRCQQMTPFIHKKVARYFTLYFIPLFPIGGGQEFVECQYCAGKFQPSLLQLGPGGPPQQAAWNGPPQQGGPPPQSGYGPPQGQPNQGYGPPQQGGYGPPPNQGYGPPAQGGYGPPPQGGAPPNQGGYGPPNQGGGGPGNQGGGGWGQK